MQEKNEKIKRLWLRAYQLEDPKAFEALFTLFYHRLLSFCLFYVHHKEPAEEVVSDVFVKCWLNRASLAEVQHPEVYLFAAVKNQSLNYLKKFSNHHIVSIGEADAGRFISSVYPEKALEQKELLFRINQAIAALPRQCRIIFRLIKEDGLKYKEVADILDISPRTVQTQLFRAIKKLRTAIEPYLQTPAGHPSQENNPNQDDPAPDRTAGNGDILPLILLFLPGSIFFL